MVRLGNYASMNVVGKGSVRLTVRDVYYVPGLKNNLFSVGQLQERGLVVLIQSNMCHIYHHTKRLIFKTTMASNRMFVLLSNTRSFKQKRDEDCIQVITQDVAHLWHLRFSHLSYKGLKTLQTKGMV